MFFSIKKVNLYRKKSQVLTFLYYQKYQKKKISQKLHMANINTL